MEAKDDRSVVVDFKKANQITEVTVTFEAENTNSYRYARKWLESHFK